MRRGVESMAACPSRLVLIALCCSLLCCARVSEARSLDGTIIFSTYRRMRFAFDIFCVELPSSLENSNFSETKLTHGDGSIINYNGFFASEADGNLIAEGSLHQGKHGLSSRGSSLEGKVLVYISEQKGRPQVHSNVYGSNGERREMDFNGMMNGNHGRSIRTDNAIRTDVLKMKSRNLEEVVGNGDDSRGDNEDKNWDEEDDDDDDVHQPVFLYDRPSIARGRVFYISSQERPQELRQSWTAVYSTSLADGLITRLTPPGVADYSPSISPSGEWMLVASYGNGTWQGETHELYTDLYIFNASDGSNRTLLVSGGGWPSWADDSTFFFHRKAEDGWWSIYKGVVEWGVLLGGYSRVNDAVSIERVTPPWIHCFTPAAFPTAKWVAVATRRPELSFRHIEIFDLENNTFFSVTNYTAPTTHHYNPFVSHDSALLGYHKCRGWLDEDRLRCMQKDMLGMGGSVPEPTGCKKRRSSPLRVPHLDAVVSPSSGLSVIRTDGDFPSFSPDGSYIAYIASAGETGVRGMHSDGSGSVEVYLNASFATVWDPVREGVVYTSSGPVFNSKASVHVVSIHNVHKLVNGDDVPLTSKVLTKDGTKNNAFPSPSPDGKYLVFRSSRSGWKNLYIIDAVQGEEGGLWRLTEGNWTDTMCSWSPDGEWISFSSDRENPESGSFSLYLIHPNGTGLCKVFANASVAGRINHSSFSPDSRSLLFTTDYAAYSSEPIGLPFQYQGYGDIFVASLDGTYLERITHVPYENGTPSWGAKYINSTEFVNEGEDVLCMFDDVNWLMDDDDNALSNMPQSLASGKSRCGYAG